MGHFKWVGGAQQKEDCQKNLKNDGFVIKNDLNLMRAPSLLKEKAYRCLKRF
jgi:hypothetical protein